MFEADTPILNQYKPPSYLFSSSLKNRCLMRVTEKDYIFQKSSSAKKAMTILEVIMVFFIVAILAVSVIPRFQIHYEVKLQAATKRVTSDIRYTQSLAVTQHQDYVIEFDVGSDIYQVYRVSDGQPAPDPFTRSPLAIDFRTDAQFAGVDISSVDFNNSNMLRFNWEGIPQDNLGVSLSSQGMIEISYKGRGVNIYVTPQTGRLRAQ